MLRNEQLVLLRYQGYAQKLGAPATNAVGSTEQPRIRTRALLLLVGLGVIGCSSVPSKPPEPKVEQKAVPPFKMQACQKPVARVMVVEDAVNSNSALQEQYKQLQIPSLSSVGRQMALKSNCLDVLDSDPLIFNVAGSAQPDFILRVRTKEIKQTAASESGGLWSKIKSYIASYSMGAMDTPPLKIDSAAVAVSLLCHKQKRVAKEFVASETEAAALKKDGPPLDWDTQKPNVNGDILARAYVRAQNDVLAYLGQQKVVCAN
jgi:hypothetical protein